MINKVILIGNLGADPETRYTQTGTSVTNLRLATTEKWNGEERTEWHRVVCFKQLAEICQQYLHKGSKVYVEGSLRTQQWERDGQKHYTTEVIAREVKFLDPKGNDSTQSSAPPVDDSVPF